MVLAYQPNVHVTGLHLTPEGFDEEKMEDEHLFTQEIVEDALGRIPDWMDVKAVSYTHLSIFWGGNLR